MLIRPATPDDAEQTVPLIYSSGPDAFDYVFAVDHSQQAKDFLTYAFARSYGMFSYCQHQVIEVDSLLNQRQPVAASMVCYSAKGFMRRNLATMLSIYKFYGFRKMFGVFNRGLKIETMIKPPRKNCWYIGHLGVRPELRGHGVGHFMIQQALLAANKQKFERLALDVSQQNPAAERLYHRLGFKTVAARDFNYNVPDRRQVANHNYMEAVCSEMTIETGSN